MGVFLFFFKLIIKQKRAQQKSLTNNFLWIKVFIVLEKVKEKLNKSGMEIFYF